MAYFRKRGKTWSYTVDIGPDPATGKRMQVTKGGFKKKGDAKLVADKIEEKVANNTFYVEGNVTLKEYVKEWFKSYKRTVKISTADTRLRMSDIIVSKLGAMKMKDIKLKHYQDMLDELTEKYAYGTISIIHATGKSIFKRAKKFKIIHEDPTEESEITRTKKTVEEYEKGMLPKYMEKEELALFLKAAKNHFSYQDYVIFVVLAYTGMRIGELAALKWTDVSFEEHVIKITKTCYLPNNNCQKFILLPPKYEASRREIVIDKSVVSVLKKHKFDQNNLREKLNEKVELYKDHGFVFSSYRHPGYPYNKATIEKRMKQILEKSGIHMNLSPHSLRHTHTSLLAEADVGLTEIMERIGHEDAEITRKIYLHVTKAKKTEASNKFSKLMKNVVKM